VWAMWAKWGTRGAKAHKPDVTPPDVANDGETGKRDKERRPSEGERCRREEARKHTKKRTKNRNGSKASARRGSVGA